MRAGLFPRARRLLLLVLSATVLLVLIGAALAVYLDRVTIQQEIMETQSQAKILALTVSPPLMRHDQKAAQDYLDEIRANPEIEAAAIYDAAGTPFATFTRQGVALPPRLNRIAKPHVAGGVLIVEEPVWQGPAFLGRVYLRSLTEPLRQRLLRYAIIALLVAMATLVVFVMGLAHVALRRANRELKCRAAELADANVKLRQEIEHRERAEAALRQAQKMEAIGQLTGGVAHDFNNLLQVIIGNLDRVLRKWREPAGDDEDRHRIETAIRGAERAATLTQRLLAFSRRQPLAAKPIDANRLVAGMTELLGRTLGETISLATRLAGDAWPTLADENQLESAILNLAVNARDAMPRGGELRIETSNVRLEPRDLPPDEEITPGDYVTIAVSDTGMGMEPEVIARAFEPFFTTKDIGQGTGLGLSQVYGFVRQSGGDVRISSKLGEGTTVRLYLPRLVTLRTANKSPDRAAPVPTGRRDELILLVEDEPDVRAFAREALRELGYRVIEASTGQEALRLLEREPYIRLLLTDIGLPGGLSGRELAGEALRRRPGLLVLFITGYERGVSARRPAPDGPPVLHKPFTHGELARHVRKLLDAGEIVTLGG